MLLFCRAFWSPDVTIYLVKSRLFVNYVFPHSVVLDSHFVYVSFHLIINDTDLSSSLVEHLST
jgi:hypothetical protein